MSTEVCVQNGKCTIDRTENGFNDEIKLSNDFEKLLMKITKNHGFNNYTVERRIISHRGGNFLAVLYEVDVKGTVKEDKSKLNLFVKCIIPNEDMNFVSLRDLYIKEMYLYNELSKIYENLQVNAKVPLKERYEFVKCYGVIREKQSETLVLENMAKQGYSTWDRMKPISIKFAQLSVIELAKFHGLSYALEVKNPKYFETKIKPMICPCNFDDDWKKFIINTSKNTLKVFEFTSLEKKIQKVVDDMLEKIPLYYRPTEMSLLCHGDYRANNILIKEVDGAVTKALPVDYQLIQMGSPINDFLYFIFGATDQALRRNHLNDLKTLYRETMRKFLNYFAIDLEDVYPTDVFENDYKERFQLGLMISLFVIPIVTAPDEEVPDLTSSKLPEINVENNDLFKKRIKEIVEDYVYWGYL